VSFVAGVEELAFFCRRAATAKNLAFVAGGDKEGAVGSKRRDPRCILFWGQRIRIFSPVAETL